MKYIIKSLFLFSVTVLFSQTEINKTALVSQKQITFRDVTVEDGLSQNSVVSIAQDSIGYLWFATQDGLNRYDGKTFKYYNKQFADVTRPTYSKLGKIYVDRGGAIWIIPLSGKLEKYDTKTDVFTIASPLKDVSTIHENGNGDYYIGTFGNGLYRIHSETSDNTIQLLKPEDKILDVYGFHSSKNLTYALTSKGVLQFNNKGGYSILISENKNISSAVTRQEEVWFGSYGSGLLVKNKASETLVKFNGFNALNTLSETLNIQSLLVDKRDRLWVATYGNGLHLIDFRLKTIRHFTAQKTNPFALHYNDILSLFEDYTGTIWLGTDGAGLSYYDENLSKFNVLTNNQTPKDINVDVVRAITVGKNKTMWLGTSGKGLTSYNSITETYKTYTISNSDISSNRIMSLLYSDQDLWIGFQGSGLNILNYSGRFKSFSELDGYTIWKIYKDSKSRIWLCTRDNGLIQFDKNKGIVKHYDAFTTEGNLNTNNIRTIEEGNGSLWIGTESDGLFQLDLNSDKIIKIEAIPNKIKSLYYNNNLLWIGTNGEGIKAYHVVSNTIKHYNRDNGLPNNVVYSILPADDGANLWLSSNRGITRFGLTNESITNYNNYDGLQALEFNTGAYFKDSDGYLYFGGLEGVNWFKPEQLTKNPIPPKTVITNFEVFDEDYELIPDSKLNHNQNTVTFNFAGLHYSLPERNNYKYQLVNYDEDWISTGNNNSANYTKLEPNTYTFKVKSSNYDNIWDEDPTTFTFSILEPWYFNTWSKSIYALLFLCSIFGIYKYLKWRWYMKMQLQLEHSETERLKKLDEFKSRLYTNISHEFRTPLTLISGPIEKQLSKQDLSKEDKIEFSLIQRNSKRLLNLVNQLLDLSKLESGSLKLNVSQGHLHILLKQICAAFEFKAKEKDINFEYKISATEDAWYDKDVVEKIVTNLLANAIKYAPEKGHVNFDVIVKDGQLIMTVINDGNTISDEALGRLFQRFYQADKNADGAGIGLSLVKELCILSHGNIVAHTMNEDDIQFTVTLPIEKSYYNQSEIDFGKQMVSETLEDDSETELLNAGDTASNSKEKPMLLVIEDDQDVRQFVKSIFENDYTVLQATQGEKGIAKALKHVPDLIISDIMMPVTDGIEVCNILKHDERTSHIPIILLTAKVGEEHEIVGLKTGADAYITKPFSSDKLKVRVEKLIQLRRQLQQHYSQSFEINPKAIATSSVDQQFLKRLQEILDDNITSPDFTAEEFGDKMLMSRMQLHRKLKALTGLSTSVFLRSQRLKLAITLLKESDYTVSEIAYEVGFNTPSYFIKCFKEEFKCTPNEYILKA